jgi:hypothetical protein
VFIEESLKGGVGIIEGVLSLEDLVVVGSFVPVRQYFIGLRDIMKPGLSAFSVFFVFVGMPLGSESFICTLDFK